MDESFDIGKYKYPDLPPVEGKKLHLGSGDRYLDGWINVDLYHEKADIKCDVRRLDVRDNEISLILAIHLLEHFHWNETLLILKEWYRVLKPGGWLVIEFPDIEKICTKFIENPSYIYRVQLLPQILGRPELPGHGHLTILWKDQVLGLLDQIGFRDIIEGKQ